MAGNEKFSNVTVIPEADVFDTLNDSTKTLVQVGGDLSELLFNSVNMAEKFFEIFFDPNPHLVKLEMYDREGVLHTYEVPNRAMDRSIALAGNGSPEGSIEGVVGDLYIDEITREIYIKKTSTGKDGWYSITPGSLSLFTKEFIYNADSNTISLHRVIEYPEHLMVFADGALLTPTWADTDSDNIPDYELSDDKTSILFYKSIENNAKILVRYLDGLGGLKGETAIKVTVGNTTTLSPDQRATVTQTNIDLNGNGEEVRLDFSIPRGQPGTSGVYIGNTAPTDKKQNVWIDTSSKGVSESDYAGMRVWDSGISSGLTTYNKIYELKHSTFDNTKVTASGGVTVNAEGVTTGFTDTNSKVVIPFQIGELAGKSWFMSIKCKIKKITSGSLPILLIGNGLQAFGSIKVKQGGFYFSARTGNTEDSSSISNNEGEKIVIPYIISDTPTLFQFDLEYNHELGLYTFSVADENGIEIEHKYWQAPEYIVKNGDRVDLHSRELYYIANEPAQNLTVGCFPIDTTGENTHNTIDEYYLQTLTIMVENNDSGELEHVYVTNKTGSDNVTLPDGSTLTINYHIANTGSKIAGMGDKVTIETLYNKTGNGNYYILDEVNKTYIMPMPDIYGILARMQAEIDALKNA